MPLTVRVLFFAVYPASLRFGLIVMWKEKGLSLFRRIFVTLVVAVCSLLLISANVQTGVIPVRTIASDLPLFSFTVNRRDAGFLPGVTVSQLQRQMTERWGMAFKKPQLVQGTLRHRGQARDKDTGATLECVVFEGESPGSVKTVQFVVDGSAIRPRGSKRLKRLAARYLGDSARLEFEGASRGLAKLWVEQELAELSSQPSAQFGPSTFRLFGLTDMPVLEIESR